MEEPIDAVALGLKRGPRGAVAVVMLVVAIPIAVVAMRSGGEGEVARLEQDQVAPVEVVTVAPTPKRPRAKRGASKPKPARQEPQAEVATEPLAPAAELADAPETLAPPPAPMPEPDSSLEETERDGNGEAIARAIAAEKRAAVRACFESELKQSPRLTGTVVVELELAPPNRVTGVRVNDDLGRPAFTSCVAATMRDVRFGALDEEISVNVPYVLTPAAK